MRGAEFLQEQLGLRALSEIKQGCYFDGHTGIRPVFSWVMNLCNIPPHWTCLFHKALQPLPVFVNTDVVMPPPTDLLPLRIVEACRPGLNFNLQLLVLCQPRGTRQCNEVGFMLRLTGSHNPSYTTNTGRLWLPSSGNWLHKKGSESTCGDLPWSVACWWC